MLIEPVERGFFSWRHPAELGRDGQLNFGDINPFVLALSNPSAWQATYPGCDILNGDINGDGSTTIADLNPFINLLSGGNGAGGLRLKYACKSGDTILISLTAQRRRDN